MLSIAYLQPVPPNLFQYNQSTFQGFYFFKNVFIDTNFVEADDWVGTFNCNKWDSDSTSCLKLGTCVGSRKWDISRCGSGVCDLPAMGDEGSGKKETEGYLKTDEYPVFLIYDSSDGIYYRTLTEGDVKIQQDVCRNGYPYCYGWKNLKLSIINTLKTKDIYMDCMGKLGGDKLLDECGICGGTGPQYTCQKTNKFYCTEAKYQLECPEE